MAIKIRNAHLELRIDRERRDRGHKTQSRTLEELAAERLGQIEYERLPHPGQRHVNTTA